MNLSNVKPQKISLTEVTGYDVSSYVSEKLSFDKIRLCLEPVMDSLLYKQRFFFSPSELEDMRQECWIEVINKLQKWDPTKAPFKLFMYYCIKHRIIAYLRKNKYFKNMVYTDQIEDHLEPVENAPLIPTELDILLQTRLQDPLAPYILQRVAITIYFSIRTTPLVKKLCHLTGASARRIRFLVDYSMVILRSYFWNKHH